jgi:hypothetical protein
MSKSLAIGQAVPRGLFQRSHCQKEPGMGRTPPQDLPQTLYDLKLGTRAGQAVQVQMRTCLKCRLHQRA